MFIVNSRFVQSDNERIHPKTIRSYFDARQVLTEAGWVHHSILKDKGKSILHLQRNCHLQRLPEMLGEFFAAPGTGLSPSWLWNARPSI